MADYERDDEATVAECGVCGGDILIEADCDEDDVVYCNDCEAEYRIRSLDPLRLVPLDDVGEPEENYGDEDDDD